MSGPAGSAVELWNGLDNALSGVEDAVNSVCRTLAWPLIQIVELVDGEPAVLRAKAAEWDALATQVRDLAQGHRGVRESAQAGWVSPSGVAYGKRLAAVEQQMLDVAEQFAATAEYLRSVADGLQTVHDVLVDLCVEFVNWMLVTLVTALLMAPVTMGASWVAGVSVTVTRALIVVTRALRSCARWRRTCRRSSACSNGSCCPCGNSRRTSTSWSPCRTSCSPAGSTSRSATPRARPTSGSTRSSTPPRAPTSWASPVRRSTWVSSTGPPRCGRTASPTALG
ncbi:hypothetical protein [Micromonospora chokoriensis]